MSILLRPADAQSLESEISFYTNLNVFEWRPSEEMAMVAMQLRRFASFVERHDIELIVVHSDEHPSSRRLQNEAAYAEYAAVLHEYLSDTTFVDLRGTLEAEMFVDNIHPTFEGALRLTHKLASLVPAPAESATSR